MMQTLFYMPATLPVFATGKGTVQFPIDKPIPFGLVRKIVQYSVKENKERGKNNHVSTGSLRKKGF